MAEQPFPGSRRLRMLACRMVERLNQRHHGPTAAAHPPSPPPHLFDTMTELLEQVPLPLLSALCRYRLDGVSKERAAQESNLASIDLDLVQVELWDEFLIKAARGMEPSLQPPPKTAPQPAVLIVDDDPVIRHLFVEATHRVTTRVAAVGTVKAAIEELDRQDYALVLLDCSLPDGLGEEVAIAACSPERIPQPVVIAISSNDDSSQIRRMLQVGAREYLVKPVSVAQLRGLLTSYLLPASAESLETAGK